MADDQDCFTADELLVAEALIELRYGSDDRKTPVLSWGRKRRRSALEDPPHQQLNWVPRVVITRGEIKNVLGEQETPSPTTPLSFTPSETESKLNPAHKDDLMKKRKRNKQHNKHEQLRATIAELSKQGEDLREALNKVKICYEEEVRLRLVLEQFLSRQSMSKTEEPIIKTEEPITAVQREDQQIQSEPSTSNQTATIKVEEPKSPQRSNAQMCFSGMEERRVSPNGLPDLNLSVVDEEISVVEAFDVISSKAVCAEARKRRYEINREKRFMALAKQR